MMTRRLSLIFAVLLASAPQATSAQNIDSPYRFVDPGQSVGPFIGWLEAGSSALEQGAESGLLFGGRYSIRVGGPFHVEGAIGYMPTQRSVFAPDSISGDELGRDFLGNADMHLLSTNVLLRFNLTGPRTWHRLQPFFVAGGGLAVDLSGATALEDELDETERFDFGTSFAGELGAGVDWFVTDRISLRLDARDILWKYDTPDTYRLPAGGRDLPGDEWVQNFVASAGLMIHF